MSEDQTPWLRLLRELFGDDAEDALAELQRMGVDPEALAQSSGMLDNPAMMDHVLSQLRSLISQSQGEDVNWTLAHDVARGVAAQGGDPTVNTATAQEHRAAVSRAELWLDAVTDFDPAHSTPAVWSRAEWVEATLPTWRQLAGPVAVSVSKALAQVLGGAVNGSAVDGEPVHDAGTGGAGMDGAALVASVSPAVCGMHVGQAAGVIAREAFGSTDLGLPLLAEPRVTLIPSTIRAFAEGLDVDEKDVQVFVALREAAHVRLFRAAPWLPGQLHTLVERYAGGISIDVAALDSAVRDIGPDNPQLLQQALTRGIFAPEHTTEQRETLASIEALLALIEGWVQDVTVRSASAHLPSLSALAEMMRRRRAAGGPAEDAFATLLNLELRPRRMREAAALWAALATRGSAQQRDAVWAHPDLLPTADDLDQREQWVDRWLAQGGPDDVDRALAALLGGNDTPATPDDDDDTAPSA